ncbi:MAG: ABC transporter permease subunit [Proteobacteria bacterium]|nr:ABC transporter permease subunit [Pseudomonadota bacterium]NIS70048.1 ABC transporter permease subunit [Pseudomonadota bacterium]
MRGIKTIFKKELADHFSSYRFLILFALIAMVSLITSYMVGLDIKENLEEVAKPRLVFLMVFTSRGAFLSLVEFVAFFGPLIGLILGFDTINRERNEGTLSKLLSQPIYRDSVINGKFLAGAATITIMMVSIVLVITGLGLNLVGVVPGLEEIWRIVIYLIISIVYISFWLGVAILFSILLRSIATSALAGFAVWIFFSFLLPYGADTVARAVTSDVGQRGPETIIRQTRIQKAITLISPMELYTDATATVIDPLRKTTRSIILMGPMERISQARFAGPLPLGQSILVVFPYIISLIAITAICFAISYTVFMRQEIRSL